MLFVPLLYGLFIAMVLYPMCKKLEKSGLSKSVAIVAGLTVILIIALLFIFILFLQVKMLYRDMPELRQRALSSLPALQGWIESNFNLPAAEQIKWLHKLINGLSADLPGIISGLSGRLTTGLFMVFIIPVFAGIFLYRGEHLIGFLGKLVGSTFKRRLHVIVGRTIFTYSRFIKGMVIVYIIVGILNSIGLLLLGIKYAVLFGFLTAVMTIIPYVGIIVSALLPISIAWLTKGSVWYPVGVVAVFTFVQYLEANVIFPKVVAVQLGVSTLVILVAILAGGMLWGISGMILFIPLVGVLKLIAGLIPEWDALNTLLSRKPG